VAGMKGRSGGARRNAGRPRKTPQERWVSGTRPRPVTVGTSAVRVSEPVAPGDVPAQWRPETQAWYAAILEDWELGPAGLQLLRHAAACLDLEVACREAGGARRAAGSWGGRREGAPVAGDGRASARAVFDGDVPAGTEQMTLQARRRVSLPGRVGARTERP
jgi:hypothetical protein